MGERIPEIGFIEFYRIIGRKRKKIERRRERRMRVPYLRGMGALEGNTHACVSGRLTWRWDVWSIDIQ